jgi:uncharacterized delta-60 repeat protein
MLEGRTLLSVGDLNLPFGGGDGMLRFPDPIAGGFAFNVVAQPDGKMVVGGSNSTKVWLERFDAKGNLDKTFGTNGLASANVKGADAFARQSDGKFIVVSGTGTTGSLIRFTSAGKIDTSFGGGDGVIPTASLSAVAILPNGKIAANNGSTVYEFNADGSPNNSFGTKGVAKVSNVFLLQVVAQKDNKLVFDGDVSNAPLDGTNPAIFRLTADGKPDTTFNHNGLVNIGLGFGTFRGAVGIAIQSTGNIIIAAGDDDDRGYLWSFKPDGEITPGFQGGAVAFSTGTDDDFDGVAVYGADNIAFFGADPDPDTNHPPHDFGILGFTSNGVLNFTKRVNFSWTDNGNTDDIPTAAAMTSDGNIIIAGNDGGDYTGTSPDVELTSLQGKPGGPSDKIPFTVTDNQITITGTTAVDKINIFGGSANSELFIEFNGKRAVIEHYGQQTLLINAGDGDDRVQNSSDAPSTINGGNGNDILIGGSANDSLSGGSGNDTLDGGLGADILSGGGGNDTADYSSRATNLDISLDNVANDGAANEKDNVMADVETILGGSGNDKLVGNPFANLLVGNAGNDILFGGKGNDTLNGGTGHDQLFGQDDNDTLLAKDGQVDSLDGGAGNDTAQRDNTASVKDQVLNIETFI